jgi:rod shape-determining protein MreD
MRLVPYIIYLLLISLFYTNLNDLTSIGPAQIQLVALMVFLVALNKKYLEALWFAFAAGIVFDAQDPAHLGAHALMLTLLSMATSFACERFNLDSLKGRILMVLAGLLVYCVPATLLYTTSGAGEFPRALLRVGLPSVAYTTALAAIFFLFQSGQWSYQKIKSLF